MPHIEDLLSDSDSSMVRNITKGIRASRKHAATRNETRFGIYLHGPDHNNDEEAGRQVAVMTLGVVDTGEVSIDQVCRSFIDAQRREYIDTGPISGPVTIRFLAHPGREELSSPRNWEDVIWGPSDEIDEDEGEEYMDNRDGFDDHHGIAPEDDELGFLNQRRRRAQPDFATSRDADYERNMKLGFHQRDIVKDIERDSLMTRLFDQAEEGRRHERETARAALEHQRNTSNKLISILIAGGGGGGGRREESSGSNPARGMKLAGDLFAFLKASTAGPPRGGGRNRGSGGGGRARRIDPNVARPAVPPSPFDETKWDNGGYGGGNGGAVDRILSATSAHELTDGNNGAAAPPNLPAVQQPEYGGGGAHIDPQAFVDGMDDAELIHLVRDRIGAIAGDHGPLVDGFLGSKLEELEGGGYDFDDDDDIPG